MAEMKNKLIIGSVILLAVILIFANSQPIEQSEETTKISADNVDKLEIIHFHGTNQCYSCVTMGALAEETISTYFTDELKSGKITFAHINAELPENYNLAKLYEVTGSSLWIGTYTKDGNFFKEENVNVWYKINDKQAYMTYLKGVIEQRLNGK